MVELNGKTEFQIELKTSTGRPVIHEIQRSLQAGPPGYSSVRNIPRVADGLGVSILSTPRAS
jgi:small subunit ribosomal protein S8